MLKLLFEVNTMFSQLRENFLTNLLWSFKLYQGVIMFLILITPHEKYDYKCQKQFSQHTCAISPEELKSVSEQVCCANTFSDYCFI